MCTNDATSCEYNHQCKDCLYNVYHPSDPQPKRRKTGLSTKDMKRYQREYSRIRRAEELAADMNAAGVL